MKRYYYECEVAYKTSGYIEVAEGENLQGALKSKFSQGYKGYEGELFSDIIRLTVREDDQEYQFQKLSALLGTPVTVGSSIYVIPKDSFLITEVTFLESMGGSNTDGSLLILVQDKDLTTEEISEYVLDTSEYDFYTDLKDAQDYVISSWLSDLPEYTGLKKEEVLKRIKEINV